MQWSANITITRTYSVKDGNGDTVNRTASAEHNILFDFIWTITSSANIAVWATPNVAASAVITTISYDPTADTWSVVVTSIMLWPYTLTTAASPNIAGISYSVSGCAATPNSTVPCVQTLSFTVSGCPGIHTDFGGISQQFNNLVYECANSTSPDCPLAVGTTRPASLNITIDAEADCGIATSTTNLTSGDVSLELKQLDYSTARDSFVDGDTLNFIFSVNTVLASAAISSVTLVQFQETTFGAGDALSTTLNTVAPPCTALTSLCFALDTAGNTLHGSPFTGSSVSLNFLVAVEIQFEGIARKKRVILSIPNQALSAETQATLVNSGYTPSILFGLVLASLTIVLF